MNPSQIVSDTTQKNVADIITNYEAEFMVEMIKVI